MLSIVKPVKTLVLGSIQLRLKNINKTNKYAEHLYNCNVDRVKTQILYSCFEMLTELNATKKGQSSMLIFNICSVSQFH